MLAGCIKSTSDTVAWLRRGRKLPSNGHGLKLNLGSSLAAYDGWVNVDSSHHVMLRKLPAFLLSTLYRHSQMPGWLSEGEYIQRLKSRRFVHHNLVYGIPFADSSADYVYSSHFIEHLYHEDGARMLQEMFRVLRPGGRARVCVPDLDHAVRLYLHGEKEQALEYFFRPAGAHICDRHKYMYDFDMLAQDLRSAGFQCVERCQFRQGRVPDLDRLDNRESETLYVEAVK
jgi:predicted SAM-dependent methyltransferase